MKFITLHKIFDETPVTMHVDHIVFLEKAYDGGTSVTLTPATGVGATIEITVREDYEALRQQLERIGS